MTVVQQLHKTGCGIACVAMATGNTYENVLLKYQKLREDGEIGGPRYALSSPKLQQLLRACGGTRFGTDRFSNRDWRHTVGGRAAIIAVDRDPRGGRYHWIFVERGRHEDRVCDPLYAQRWSVDYLDKPTDLRRSHYKINPGTEHILLR